MERYYQFGGLEFAISGPGDRMYTNERRLAPFRVEAVRDPHRFVFSFVDELSPPEGDRVAELPDRLIFPGLCYIGNVGKGWQGAYIRGSHRGKEHRIQIRNAAAPERVGVHTVLGAVEIEHLVTQNNGVIVHASYIFHQGRAILFTAPSGTGKSTQAELWRELRSARIVNGDRAIIRDGQAMGLPFAGSSQYCENVTAPLAAIVCLGQAPQTTITRLRGLAAFRKIWEGCSVNTWNREDVARASDAVARMVQTVPVYFLNCTPDESAVIALEELL